jgi:hypothetical protein
MTDKGGPGPPFFYSYYLSGLNLSTGEELAFTSTWAHWRGDKSSTPVRYCVSTFADATMAFQRGISFAT